MTAQLLQGLCPEQQAPAPLSARRVTGGLPAKAVHAIPVTNGCRNSRPQEEGVAPARTAFREALALPRGRLGVLVAAGGQESRRAREVILGAVDQGQPLRLHGSA